MIHVFFLFLYLCFSHRVFHSFPTRRSSDLVAASVYCVRDPAGNVMPEPVFANIGKLLLATQIYDMHRLAHEVSGGLVGERSEEHTSELQSLTNLVCRLLLEKKKNKENKL